MKRYIEADSNEQKSLNDITEKECLEIANEIFYDAILQTRDEWCNYFASNGWDIFEKYGLNYDEFEDANYNEVLGGNIEVRDKIWDAIDTIEWSLLDTLKRYQ